MLNPNARKWVEALRSGNFKQAQHALKSNGGYCCLGVACEISGLAIWNGKSYDGANQVLPESVRLWLGLKTLQGDYKDNLLSFKCLAEENDEGTTFAQIAEIIEREPEGLFINSDEKTNEKTI